MSLEAALQSSAPALSYRLARARDGRAMWKLVRDMGGLELNSAYFYVLFCMEFTDTCVVAETDDGRLAGFALGHRPPTRPDAVFVWQIGVAPWMRRQGLAVRLLEALFARQSAPVRWLEASVTPDNIGSASLFRAFARNHDAACEESDFMDAGLFPGEHAEERLFRIGPLSPAATEETSG